MKEFMMAALPWICIGIAVALFAANHGAVKKAKASGKEYGNYYLFRDDIEKMLKSIASIAADGSTLLFDYADAGLFLSDEKRVQNMVAMAKAGGEEMKSSFDYWSMEQMLSNYGFLIYEILEPKDIQTRIIGKRGMKAFEHINYVQAVIKKNNLEFDGGSYGI